MSLKELCPLARSVAEALRRDGLMPIEEALAAVSVIENFCSHMHLLPGIVTLTMGKETGRAAMSVVYTNWEIATRDING